METLKRYMASLSPRQKRDFAESCGTTINYLRKVMSTGSVIGPEICVQIEIQSGGAVSRQSLNPENWQRIWPELKGTESTPENNEVCCGQLKLATALEFFQYRFSDSFGGNPPLYSCGLSAL